MHFDQGLSLATILLLSLSTATPVPSKLNTNAIEVRRNIASGPATTHVHAAYHERAIHAKEVTVAHNKAMEFKRQEENQEESQDSGDPPTEDIGNKKEKAKRQDDSGGNPEEGDNDGIGPGSDSAAFWGATSDTGPASDTEEFYNGKSNYPRQAPDVDSSSSEGGDPGDGTNSGDGSDVGSDSLTEPTTLLTRRRP